MTRSDIRKIIYDLRTGRKGLIFYDIKTTQINEDMMRQINKNIDRGYKPTEAVRAAIESAGFHPQLKPGVTKEQLEKRLERYNKRLAEDIKKGLVTPGSVHPYDVKKKRSSAEMARAVSKTTGGARRVGERQLQALRVKVLDSVDEFTGYLVSRGLNSTIGFVMKTKIETMSAESINTAMKILGGKQLIEIFYSDAAKVNFRHTMKAFGLNKQDFINAGIDKEDLHALGVR